MNVHQGLMARTLAAISVSTALLMAPAAHAQSSAAVPIAWSSFTAGAPTDGDALRVKTILLNANKYALNTWYASAGYAAQTGTYLTFGGTGETNIRPPSDQALSLAISISTNAYDAGVTGVTLTTAKARALKLITSLALAHKANTSGGWGDAWQSALWAHNAGMAGWMLWADMITTDREYVRKMVEYEANRFNSYIAPYYKDRTGASPDITDSKGEENAWNGMVMSLAVNMMPDHANMVKWKRKNVELMVSAFATPADVTSVTMVNGKPLWQWLNGSNLNSDYTMINHGIVHADYMCAIYNNMHAGLIYTLAGKATPMAALFNANRVYETLVEKYFAVGTTPYPVGGAIRSPGGTMYTPGSDALFYPQGNDWGYGRRMNFAMLDASARHFGFDDLVANKGAYWEPLHAQKVLDMQNRFTDGHTYLSATEDSYVGRENWVAALAARSYLVKWVKTQGTFATTTADFANFTVMDNNDVSGVTLTGAWTTSSFDDHRIGANYLHDTNAGKGSKSVAFTPNLTAGTYKVFLYWSADPNRATNTPVTITHSGGTSSATINQTANGGKWMQVGGTYTFAGGTGGSVNISNTGTNGFVVVDAIKFERQ